MARRGSTTVDNQHDDFDDGGWDTASEGTANRVEFDTDGETFEGVYRGPVKIQNGDEVYDYLEFTGTDGEPYQISASYQLSRVFENIEQGTFCRITRKREIPMGNGRNPMKDYRVQTRRS